MEQHNGSVLRDFFENHPHRMIHKWMHYFEIYERHFNQFRGKPMSMLEFGVLHGGSLQMWKYYFGKEARIYGAVQFFQHRVDEILFGQVTHCCSP